MQPEHVFREQASYVAHGCVLPLNIPAILAPWFVFLEQVSSSILILGGGISEHSSNPLHRSCTSPLCSYAWLGIPWNTVCWCFGANPAWTLEPEGKLARISFCAISKTFSCIWESHTRCLDYNRKSQIEWHSYFCATPKVASAFSSDPSTHRVFWPAQVIKNV